MSDTHVDLLTRRVGESVEVKRALLADHDLLRVAADVARTITAALRAGGKVVFFGNGGSATDAAHLSAELLGRFYLDRAPLPSIALAGNTAAMTAIANDYAYDDVFARPLRALCRPGDVAVGLSTSGNSGNVVAALQAGRDLGVTTVAMTGATGGACKQHADLLLAMPTSDTPRVQECHMLVGHTICELVERELADAAPD